MCNVRHLLLFVFLLSWSKTYNQALEWLTPFGSSTANLKSDGMLLVEGESGSLYALGRAGGSTWDIDGEQVTIAGESDMLLVKLDPIGDVEWARVAGGPCEGQGASWLDEVSAIVNGPTSNQVIVAGVYSGPADFGGVDLEGACDMRHMYLAAYSDAGNVVWAKSGIGADVAPYVLIPGPSSEILVFGSTVSSATFQETPLVQAGAGGFLATYSGVGTVLGAERILRTGAVYGGAQNQTGYFLCGGFNENDTLWETPLEPNSPGLSGFLCRTTNTNEVNWAVTIGSSTMAVFSNCATLSNGDVVTHGYFIGDVYFSSDTLSVAQDEAGLFIARYSAIGDLLWAKKLTASGLVLGLGTIQTGPDDSFYVAGTFAEALVIGNTVLESSTSRDNFVGRFNGAGDIVAALNVGRVRFGHGVGLLVNTDGVFIASNFDSTMVIGSDEFEPLHVSYTDLFVAKFDELPIVSSIHSLGLLDGELHIYANPNNGHCTIDLPSAVKPGRDLILTVYDATGNVVQQASAQWTNGTIKVDIHGQAKGVYHAELIDGRRRYSGSIVLE